jgi:aryl-alcohol dehydrogenase-like predicted oxidoreductase
VERVDLMQMHWPPEGGADPGGVLGRTRRAPERRKIRAAGVSNFSVAQLESAERIGHVDTCQPPLSMLRRTAAAVEIPWCAAHDTGVIVYSPMESGLLSGAFDRERGRPRCRRSDWRSHAPGYSGAELDRTLALVAAAREIAGRRDVPVAAVAVAWTLAWPGVTGAIVGARRPGQLDAWLPAATLTLHHQDLDRPGRGAPGPRLGSGPQRPPGPAEVVTEGGWSRGS